MFLRPNRGMSHSVSVVLSPAPATPAPGRHSATHKPLLGNSMLYFYVIATAKLTQASVVKCCVQRPAPCHVTMIVEIMQRIIT